LQIQSKDYNQMKLTVHEEDDALYLRLDDSAIVESEEIKDGIILDYNEVGKVVGIEAWDKLGY